MNDDSILKKGITVKKTVIVAATLAALAAAAPGEITQRWMTQRARFYPSRVLSDASGNVLVFGTQYAAGSTLADMAVLAYTPEGQPLWTWSSGLAADERVADACLDAQGNMILAGNLGASWRVVKVSPARQVVWATTYVPPGQDFADDVPYRVLADATGVYVAGYTLGPITEDARLTKFSPAGAVLWSQVRGIDERWDRFQDMALDPQGNVVVVGEVGNSNADEQLKFAVMSFTPAGAPRWAHYFMGVWPPEQQGFFEGGDARCVAIDGAGNVYAAGQVSDDMQFNDIFVAKFSSTGAVRWTRQWDGAAPLGDPDYGLYERAYAMALGPGDRVYLTGEEFHNVGWNYFDMPTIAFDGAGNALWADAYNGGDTTNDSEDVAMNILVDEFGRVITVGSDWTKPGSDCVVQVHDASGVLADQARFDTPGLDYDIDTSRCAMVLPGGRLFFAATAGGLPPLAAGTAVFGMLSLGTPGPSCNPDYTADGVTDQDDVACLIATIAGDGSCTGLDPDFNRDGVADQDDLAALINVIAGGGCP